MKRLQQQKGFTLVELAIVLTIIGLLIGGILKGQQLITNAKVTAQMSQIQAVEAATTTFNDTYQGLPGDLATAQARLPLGATTGCGNLPCTNGNGDGVIAPAAGPTPLPTATALASENIFYWLELADAGLLSGINNSAAAAIAPWGISLPQAKIGGGMVVNTLTGAGAGYPKAGTYITVGSLNNAANLTAPATAAAGVMTANQAGQIDRKTDDGVANTGDVIGSGALCQAAGVYGEAVAADVGTTCAMSWRIQQ